LKEETCFELLSVQAKILKENGYKVRNESITMHQYIYIYIYVCCRDWPCTYGLCGRSL